MISLEVIDLYFFFFHQAKQLWSIVSSFWIIPKFPSASRARLMRMPSQMPLKSMKTQGLPYNEVF
jgi:hypothetical protein